MQETSCNKKTSFQRTNITGIGGPGAILEIAASPARPYTDGSPGLVPDLVSLYQSHASLTFAFSMRPAAARQLAAALIAAAESLEG